MFVEGAKITAFILAVTGIDAIYSILTLLTVFLGFRICQVTHGALLTPLQASSAFTCHKHVCPGYPASAAVKLREPLHLPLLTRRMLCCAEKHVTVAQHIYRSELRFIVRVFVRGRPTMGLAPADDSVNLQC